MKNVKWNYDEKKGKQILDALMACCPHGVDKPSPYSGRGMGGKTCLSLSLRGTEVFILFAALGSYDSSLAVELAETCHQDSMGRGVVLYWPGLTGEPEEEAADE